MIRYNVLEGENIRMYKNTRRKTFMIAALSATMLLVACQPNTAISQTEEVTNVSQVMEVDTKAGEDRRSITTVRGEVEVPVHPEKVVVLNNGFGDVLALGVVPAGINDYWALSGSPVEELLKDVPRVNEPEEIMALEPDLIITSFEKDEDYDKLSKIAPTVSLGQAGDNLSQTPKERLDFLGNLLGVDTSLVDETIEEYNEIIELGKKQLEDNNVLGKSVTILTGSLEDASVIVSTYKGADALYEELKMTRNDKCQSLYESGEWYGSISLETLPEYCGDYIIIYGDENPFEGNAVYDNLEAVKAGRVILVDEYLVNFNDVISVETQIDYLVDKLLKVSTPN